MAWIRDHGAALLGPNYDVGQLELDLSMDTLSELRRAVFVNQGWRLTKVGLRLLAQNYNSYRCGNDDNRIMTGRILVSMDAAVGGPWGYRDRDIFVFDQGVHFELQMCDGNARRFVEFKTGG